MKTRTFFSSVLFVGYVWSICILFDSLSLWGGRGLCSTRLSYLFLDNFMFVSVSVLPTVVFALIIFLMLMPVSKRLSDEKIIAVALAVSFFTVAFMLLAPQNKFSKLKDYSPAFLWSILSACGVGAIAYLFNRGLVKKLFNLLIVPSFAAVVATMPFLMRAMHELYLVKKIGASPLRLLDSLLYALPFMALFLVFLFWFRRKPKAAALLGWSFLVISLFFTVFHPILYKNSMVECKNPSAETDKPNFLFIVIDALRADALEPYGGEISTPNISEFAGKSVLFENAYSVATWTMPSMPSLFTGLYPTAHGVGNFMSVLDSKFDTVYRALKRNGYSTWAVLDQNLFTSYRGINEGFDTFDFVQCHPCQLILTHPLVRKSFEKTEVRRFPFCDRPTTQVARDVSNVIERTCTPFFGWVHFLDPHMALTPPKKFTDHIKEPEKKFKWGRMHRTKVLEVLSRAEIAKGDIFFDKKLAKRLKDLYLAEVRYVDYEMARIFEALEKVGEKTVVIITADHGEELLDHGSFEHGHSVYDEVLRVPFIIYVPGVEPKRVQSRVRSIDIVPTILELAKVEYKPDSLQGQSLIPLINGAIEKDREVLAESTLYYEERKALLSGQYKLIWRPLSGEYFLFNIKEDPKELYPIVGENAVKVQMLKRLKEIFKSSEKIYKEVTGKSPGQTYEPLSPATIEQLKALGYIE